MGFLFSSADMPAPTAAEREELAITYAALVLHDDGLPITEANLNAILTAANIKFVSAYWPRIFAKLLEGKDSETLDDIIVGGGAAPAVGGGAAAGGPPLEVLPPLPPKRRRRLRKRRRSPMRT